MSKTKFMVFCYKVLTFISLLQNFMSKNEIVFPTLAKCGGEAQHLEKSGVGVLRDSRMFRARQQGPKHLA
jgi:hypothetical protein